MNQKRKEIALFEDSLRTKEEKGNYEWWYTDVKLDDGGSIVIVFYTCPITGSKKFKPHVGLNFTSKDGKEVKVEAHSNDYSFSSLVLKESSNKAISFLF